MWVLRTAEEAESPLTFRMLPGSIKTVGRAAVLDISQRSGPSSPNRRVTFEPSFVGEAQ